MLKVSMTHTLICFFFILSSVYMIVAIIDIDLLIVRVESADDSVPLWSDDFEGDPVNEFPVQWSGSGNAPGGNSVVTDQEHYTGTHSFCLEGIYGSCWEALAHRQINLSKTVGSSYVVEFAIKIGGHAIGCHSILAGVGLNTGPDWGTQGRELVDFSPDGNTTLVGGKALGTFPGDTWFVVKIQYQWVSDSTIQLYCWLNGEYQGNASVPVEGFEADLNYLTLHSGDGITWYDDIAVSYVIESSPQDETPTNTPPNANFSYDPEYPRINEEIRFNSSKSIDKDGTIVDWLWDFNDGTISHLKNPHHFFTQTGKYHVRLSVTDDDGAVTSVSRNISVIGTTQNVLFTENIQDYGLDENNDGYYEYLIIETEVNILKRGTYEVNANFYSTLKENSLITNWYDFDDVSLARYEVGLHTIYLKIDHNHIFNSRYSGIFRVSLVINNYTGWNTWEVMQYLDYNTSNYDYQEFSPSDAKFVDDVVDYGYDADNNGYYEWLVFETQIQVTTPGYYVLQGVIYTYNQSYSYKKPESLDGIVHEPRYFANGSHIVYFNFSGLTIRNSSYSGNFLCKFWLRNESFNTILDEKEYETHSYNVNEFGWSWNKPVSNLLNNIPSVVYYVFILLIVAIIFIAFIKHRRTVKPPTPVTRTRDSEKDTETKGKPSVTITDNKTTKKKKKKIVTSGERPDITRVPLPGNPYPDLPDTIQITEASESKTLQKLRQLFEDKEFEKILGVNEDASDEEIENHYHSIIMELEQSETTSGEKKAVRTIIEQAYNTLSDHKERKKLFLERFFIKFSNDNDVDKKYQNKVSKFRNELLNDEKLKDAPITTFTSKGIKQYLHERLIELLIQNNEIQKLDFFEEEIKEYDTPKHTIELSYQENQENVTLKGPFRNKKIIAYDGGKHLYQTNVIPEKFKVYDVIRRLKAKIPNRINWNDEWTIKKVIWNYAKRHYQQNKCIDIERLTREIINDIING